LIHTIVLLQSVRQCVSQQEAAELLATAADSVASTTSATVASEASAAAALLHDMSSGTDDDSTVVQPLPVKLSHPKLPEVKQLLKYAVLHRSLELADNYFINRYKLQVVELLRY
jgi:hypothetical protein